MDERTANYVYIDGDGKRRTMRTTVHLAIKEAMEHMDAGIHPEAIYSEDGEIIVSMQRLTDIYLEREEA